VPLDYSVIRFQHAEIPFGYWLSDNVTITDTGVDDPLPAGQRVARSFGGVNVAVARHTRAELRHPQHRTGLCDSTCVRHRMLRRQGTP
jgi:hypothetical protein